MSRQKMKTVNEVCLMMHVTRKTLYYYDKVGILKPTIRAGKQKAKLYDEEQLLKLQMILKYKKAGVSLDRIKQMMNESNKIKVQALEEVIVQMKLDIEAMNHRIHYAEKLIHELKENDDETIE